MGRVGEVGLIAAVAQGEVGVVVALEVTRLARNSPDWHHLLYLCRFTETLIADELLFVTFSRWNPTAFDRTIPSTDCLG